MPEDKIISHCVVCMSLYRAKTDMGGSKPLLDIENNLYELIIFKWIYCICG
jgi:hypothetical protein